MKSGKFEDSFLTEHIFNKITHKRSEVLQGSGTGIDSAVLDLEGDLLVVTTDPVTAAAANMGRLCVHICCNDIAAEGAEPVAIFVTMLVPLDADVEDVQTVIEDLHAACAETNIQLAGGHTEKTEAVRRIILSATAIGRKTEKNRQAVKPGDVLIMTKGAAYEGSSIIASDFREKISSIAEESQIAFLKSLLEQISVLPESRIAVKCGAKRMHDITEGGVLGAAWEISRAAGCNVEVWCDEIFIHPETTLICDSLGLDPLRLISSGSLLIACAAEDATEMIQKLDEAGIRARQIGVFTTEKNSYVQKGIKQILDEPAEDEIYKL